jgi:hypothetical protein
MQDLVGEPEGKRPLQRPRYRWKVKIIMDPREIGWGGVDWTDLPQGYGLVASSCKHDSESLGSVKH